MDASFKLPAVQIQAQMLRVGEVCRDSKLAETAARRWQVQAGAGVDVFAVGDYLNSRFSKPASRAPAIDKRCSMTGVKRSI